MTERAAPGPSNKGREAALTALELADLAADGVVYAEVRYAPEQHLVAELIREQALALVRDELPHSVAVLVDEMGPDPDREDLLVIRATLFVEPASQKPIVLGRRGAVLREIGTRARAELEALLGAHVFLDLHVKVAKEWQRDPRQLARLGF